MVFLALQLKLFKYTGYFQIDPAEGQDRMRPKLLTGSSLLAGLIGSGSSIAIFTATIGSVSRGTLDPRFRAGGWTWLIQVVPTILAALMAGIFVYRHTARRRKLQAALTLILTSLVSLATQVAWLLLNLY